MENKGSSLAQISLGINVALIIAVIILFVKMPGGSSSEDIVNGNDSTDTVDPIIPDDGIMTIGYFQADSLNNNLLLMTELESMLEDASKDADNKMRSEESKVEKWQAKWQNGGVLLQSEQARYQQEAQEMEQNYMQAQQSIQMELAAAQEQHMFTLISRVTKGAKEYAEANGYDLIFSYQLGQNLYYASPNNDVTDGLIELMNADYMERSTLPEVDPVEAVNGGE